MAESAGKTVVRAHVTVSGRVQGVGYRAFAASAASRLGLLGGVRNLEDGRVELEVEGAKAAIEALLPELKTGPPAGHVTRIETEWKEATQRFLRFSIWY
jgi:acylphosphatase